MALNSLLPLCTAYLCKDRTLSFNDFKIKIFVNSEKHKGGCMFSRHLMFIENISKHILLEKNSHCSMGNKKNKRKFSVNFRNCPLGLSSEFQIHIHIYSFPISMYQNNMYQRELCSSRLILNLSLFKSISISLIVNLEMQNCHCVIIIKTNIVSFLCYKHRMLLH